MAKISQTAIVDFSSRLLEEQDALKSFVSLLETEQQALLGGNPEQLLALSENKIRAASELGKLAENRQNGLLAFGAINGVGGVKVWLQAHAANLLPVWRNIQQLAAQAQQLNRTNGVLIQTKLRHNQQALTALQNAAHKTSGLYGPDGQPHLTGAGRVLGSV
jgi:flagella synthesis protein FlgN